MVRLKRRDSGRRPLEEGGLQIDPDNAGFDVARNHDLGRSRKVPGIIAPSPSAPEEVASRSLQLHHGLSRVASAHLLVF
jgi:hypothetical protein